MQEGENGYKGVESGLTDLKDGKWSWDFYPKKDDVLRRAAKPEARANRRKQPVRAPSMRGFAEIRTKLFSR